MGAVPTKIITLCPFQTTSLYRNSYIKEYCVCVFYTSHRLKSPSEITVRNHYPKLAILVPNSDIKDYKKGRPNSPQTVQNHRPNSPRRLNSSHTLRNHCPLSPPEITDRRPKSFGIHNKERIWKLK